MVTSQDALGLGAPGCRAAAECSAASQPLCQPAGILRRCLIAASQPASRYFPSKPVKTTKSSLQSMSQGSRIWQKRFGEGDVGGGQKNIPTENWTRGKTAFRSTESGAGEQFLLLDCRAKARTQIFVHCHRYREVYGAIQGQDQGTRERGALFQRRRHLLLPYRRTPLWGPHRTLPPQT